MKIWIDDIRPAPEGYEWCKSVVEFELSYRSKISEIELIDLDHDAGEYAIEGGDYIEILKDLDKWYNEYLDYYLRMEDVHALKMAADIAAIKFRIHSSNPIGAENMKRIIRHNDWEEIQ